MLTKKAMVYLLAFILLTGIFGCMAVRRVINPDRYFLRRIDPIEFTKVFIADFKGSLDVSPDIGDKYIYRNSGKIRHSINYTFRLDDLDYAFRVDDSRNFILIDIASNSSFVIGEVISKENSEYDNCDRYKIKIKEDYKTLYTYAEGIFPYHTKVQFTMMSSGGNKYSSETCATLTSPSGDYLKLYQSSGYIKTGERTGIYMKSGN